MARKCKQCKQRAGQPSLKGICRHCWDEAQKLKVNAKQKELDNIRVAKARSAEDFRKLADNLKDVLVAAAKGETKINAAQAALIKTVFDRGYGRPTASQESRTAAAGIVILPTLGSNEGLTICPNCGWEAKIEEEDEESTDSMATKPGASTSVSSIDSAGDTVRGSSGGRED